MQDEFRFFRDSAKGINHVINENIIVRNPTLDEICDFGEYKYYSIVNALSCSSASYKVALWDMYNTYWTEVSDYDFFMLMCQSLPRESTSILLGDLDLSALKSANAPNRQIVLADADADGQLKTVIDKALYCELSSHIRKMHGFEHKVELVTDEHTKKYMVKRERERLARHKNDPQKSLLKPLVSSMVNYHGFKYDYSSVWDLPITIFNDSAHRIQKYLNYTHVMQGVYNGVIDMKKAKFSSEEINWLN